MNTYCRFDRDTRITITDQCFQGGMTTFSFCRNLKKDALIDRKSQPMRIIRNLERIFVNYHNPVNTHDPRSLRRQRQHSTTDSSTDPSSSPPPPVRPQSPPQPEPESQSESQSDSESQQSRNNHNNQNPNHNQNQNHIPHHVVQVTPQTHTYFHPLLIHPKSVSTVTVCMIWI